ncbi:hypothetical protein O181_036550 [Austropuccinia psidii MF-1]|uniref:Uncharacterized protein n=1 Tax=Austropuccinia psidii MF-1 TaxID=1389203 RepID=A0A9Q3D959_9BASI|nr:hypothetical protein [Austropuccinia psidii MF-1]
MTTDTLKYQLCHKEVIGYSHSQYSSIGRLAVHSQGIFKRQFQNNFPSVNAPSMYLGNKIHFHTALFYKDLYLSHTPWEDHSTQFISQFGKVYTSSTNQYSFKVAIQTSIQPEGAKLSTENIYQPHF